MKRLLTSFFLSLYLFYKAILIIIHPINPYNYDIFFPIIFYVVYCSFKICHQSFFENFQTVCGRLFFLWILSFYDRVDSPLCYADVTNYSWRCICQILRTHQIKNGFLIFLLPLIVFSGGWHLHLQAIFHRQFLSSNHSGFNLQRAWPHIPMPILIEEFQNHPIKPGRWENLNTPEHYEKQCSFTKSDLGNY